MTKLNSEIKSHNAMVVRASVIQENPQSSNPLSATKQSLRRGQQTISSLTKIKNRGYLMIGVNSNHRPLTFKDDNDNLQGFEIDLIHRLAKELLGDESAVKFVPLSNVNRLQAVIDGDVDMTIASVSATPSRYRIVDFSFYYYLSGTVIVTHTDNTFDTLSANHKIAVLEGSSAIALLKYHLPSVRLVGVSSYQEGLALINQKKITGFATDRTTATGWVQQNPDYRILPNIYGAYPLAIVMPKGLQYQELRDQVNGTIKKLEQQGWLKEKAEYWGL